MTDETASPVQVVDPEDRLRDLGEIIRTYNAVTENLQRSHESLTAEVARLQKELASADAQLQRSRRLAALGEMAAGIAHEIRNPLGGIQLYAGFLVEDLGAVAEGSVEADEVEPTVERCAETAQKIQAAVHGLDAIVHDVLSFAREIKPDAIDLPAVFAFDRVIDAVAPKLDETHIKVCVDCDEDMLVRADPGLLQQAMLNLVRNAIAAMEGRGGTLTLAAEPREQQVALVVRDTGPGIDEQAIDRIFNPFFTTRNTGTGLGLAIVHRIVDAHGGTIAVRNQTLAIDGQDGGAVFEISLPGGRHSECEASVGEGERRLEASVVRGE